MKRMEIAPGVTRIELVPEEAGSFEPICFLDAGREYLRQTAFEAAVRPVYRLSAADAEGAVKQTANGEVVIFDDGERVLLRRSHSATVRFVCGAGEILTGLGQHEDGVFDYANGEERLYQHNMKISIPFLLSSTGWGLLIEADCAMRFRGKGGSFAFEMNAVKSFSYVVFRGRDCAEVLKKLAALVGKPALLPKWAFGYVQSKERYKTADELIEVVRRFRKLGLGLDCIVLDWMSWRDGCWGDKTPDPERFPDVHALTESLHDLNARMMVSVWPNCAKGDDCDEFLASGAFLPGSRIYDAFSDAAREMYWQQCRRHWMDGGADALWCDSCEPITDPDWCGSDKRDADERMRLITEASELRMDPERANDYGAVHLRGLSERWRRDLPDKRPVLLARSGGIDASSLGGILWSGDVAARWEVLGRQVTEGIKAAASGICWWTLDIGGFFVGQRKQWFWRGDYPDGVEDPGYRELYVRWFQFGALLPVFRAHGTDTPREPWRFGNGAEYRCLKDTIALRYRLLPYIYATAARSCREGMPMIRAMMIAFPKETALFPLSDQYMLGDALLVKPVTRALADGGDVTEIALPQGDWYDLSTLECHAGGRRLEMPTPLDRFPLFARAGSILPLAEGARCAADLPKPARTLWVFGGMDGRFDWYDDDGDGDAGRLLIPVSYEDAGATLTLDRCTGVLAAPITLTVRLIRPDGGALEKALRYDGAPARISFRE
ncbi:MAG: glycoside hydrolase [Clostridia bacterium]|nr:glycoside hydrolase [Clostridia bacterium]